MIQQIKVTGNKEEVRFRYCPHCGDERYKVYYNLNKRVGHCFICREKVTAGDLKMGSPLFVQKLSDMIRHYINIWSPQDQEKGFDYWYHDHIPMPGKRLLTDKDQLSEFPSAANYLINYLFGREIDIDTQLSLGPYLRYNGYSLYFIIFDLMTRPIYYVERDCRPSVDSYLFPKGLSKLGMIYVPIIYGTQQTIMKEEGGRIFQNIMIVEGILDALKANKVRPTVSILGKHLDEIQQKKLLQLSESFTVLLDGDAPASSLDTFKRLREEAPTNVVFLERDKDPNDLPLVRIEEIGYPE